MPDPFSSTSTTNTSTNAGNSGFNELFYNQLTGFLGGLPGGGLPGASGFLPSAVPGPQELNVLGRIFSAGTNPQLINPSEQYGLSELAKAADPTGRLAAAKSAYEGISAPTINSTMTAQGQGRSGATLEALSNNAVNQYTLPILSQVAGAQGALGTQALALGNTLDTRQFTHLNAALGAAGVPRTAFTNEYLRPLNSLLTLLGGGNSGNTGSNTTQTTTTPTNYLTQFAIPLLTAILMGK